MKKALISGSILLSLMLASSAFAYSVSSDDEAEANGGGVNASVNVSASADTQVCTGLQHSCPCATGNYCLAQGAMCLNPTSACPNTTVKKDGEGNTDDNRSEVEESRENSSTSGNTVSAAATLKFEGSDVRGMTSAEKTQFLQTVKTHAQLQSGQDLDNFAKGVLLKDENVDSVAVNDNDVQVNYKVPAKFLGIFKSSLRANGDIALNATSTDKVKVKYPWYSFLFSLNSTSTPDQIKAAIESELAASSSTENSMNKNAKGGLYIDVMVRIFSKWLAK